MQILDKQEGLRKYACSDHWNDPGMMEVGNGVAVNEDRAHFAMWSMLAALVIAGNNLRKMSKETKEVLTNKEVIAVNQDSIGIQVYKDSEIDGMEICFKPLKGGDWAVTFFDRSKAAKKLIFNWKEQDVKDEIFNKGASFDNTTYKVHNLITKKKLGNTKKALKTEVPGHDVVMLRLSK